jgi:hypothetical protein
MTMLFDLEGNPLTPEEYAQRREAALAEGGMMLGLDPIADKVRLTVGEETYARMEAEAQAQGMSIEKYLEKTAHDMVRQADEGRFDPGFHLTISRRSTGITIHDQEVLERLKSLARVNKMTLDDYLNKLLLRITAEICGKDRLKDMPQANWMCRTYEGEVRKGVV